MVSSPNEGYAPSAAADLLESLAHDIVNFQPTAKLKKDLVSTFLLSDYGSSMFGLEIQDDEAFIGIPELFFPRFYNVKWHSAISMSKFSRLFFLGKSNIQGLETTFAIGIKIRKKRLEAINNFASIKCCCMDHFGQSEAEHECFTLNLTQADDLFWEKASKNT